MRKPYGWVWWLILPVCSTVVTGVRLATMREELEMLKEAEFIRELFADEFAQAEARGEAQGEARGEARRARAMLRRLLNQKFGELPETVARQIEQQDADWCEAMAVQAITAPSLEAMGLASTEPDNGTA